MRRGARRPRLGIAEDILEVNVCDIAGKVADEDAVLDGVVDGAELLSNSGLGEGKSAQSNLIGWLEFGAGAGGQHRD
jgi:hypothetical protein